MIFDLSYELLLYIGHIQFPTADQFTYILFEYILRYEIILIESKSSSLDKSTKSPEASQLEMETSFSNCINILLDLLEENNLNHIDFIFQSTASCFYKLIDPKTFQHIACMELKV